MTVTRRRRRGSLVPALLLPGRHGHADLSCGAQANWLLKILLSAGLSCSFGTWSAGLCLDASPLEAAHTICIQLLPCRPSCPLSPLHPLLHPPSPFSHSTFVSCQVQAPDLSLPDPGGPVVSSWLPKFTCSGRSSSSRPEACLLPGLPHRPGPFPPPVCHFPFPCPSLPDMPGL